MAANLPNAPYHRITHGQLTIEGWSRAGVQSYWRIPEWRMGFDIGAAAWDFLHTNIVLISHAHLDHLAGLPVFLARRAMMKLPPPQIVVPAEVRDDVQRLLDCWKVLDKGPQDCELIGMLPGDRLSLTELLFISAFATVHTVPSRGYIIWEKRQKLKSMYADLPNDELRRLREEGQILSEEVHVPLVCYTGDTNADGWDREPAVFKSKILITELSFAREEHSRERIRTFGHTHLDDFVDRAERFENELIIAAHVTTRDTPEQFRQWAKAKLPESLFHRMLIWD